MNRVFASRYKWSHDKRRRVLQKAYKNGDVILLDRTREGWLYGVPENFKKKY